MHYFTLSSFLTELRKVTASDADSSYNLIDTEPTLLCFPFKETGSSKTVIPCIGAFWQMANSEGKKHTVGFCRRLDAAPGETESYFPICGPAAMKDGLLPTEFATMVTDAAGHLPSAQRDTFEEHAAKASGYSAGESACGFWRAYNARSKALGCKHVATVANKLTQSMTAEVLDSLASMPAGATKKAKKHSALEQVFSRVCPANPKGSRKFPVLVLGEHGSGKTTEARAFAASNGFDCFIEAQGHAGVEAVDFLGGVLPMEGGSLVWVDGPITQAFRMAANGKKVLLYVDEIYRVPRRERSIFLTSLSPARLPDGRICLRLRTGRAIPSASPDLPPVLETVEAPECNISIIATTNIGAAYDVEEDDPAESSRWHKVFYGFSKDNTLAILRTEAASLDLPADSADAAVRFALNMRKVQTDGEAKLAPTVRELVRAFHIACAKTKVAVRDALEEMIPGWVGLDTTGEPVKEQISACLAALNSAFKT